MRYERIITIRIITSIILLPVLTRIGHTDEARRIMKAGITAYETNDFASAATDFSDAAKAIEEDQDLDPSMAWFNQGNALYRLNEFEEAEQAYQKAIRTSDLQLQSDCYYNRGNTLMNTIAGAEQQNQLDEGIKTVEEALSMYENSILLNAADDKAKINFELALRKKEQLKQQKQQQQQNQDQQDQDQDQDQDQQDKQQNQDQQQQDQQQKDQQEQEQQQQEQQEQEQEQQEQQEQQPQEGQADGEEQQQQQAQPPASEEMTEEEAEMMLDAMKADEKAQRQRMRLIMGRPEPPTNGKDW